MQLQGNHKIVLEHYPKKVSNSGRYEVRLHEDDWVRRRKNKICTFPMNFSSLIINTGNQGGEQRPCDERNNHGGTTERAETSHQVQHCIKFFYGL